MMCKVYTDVGGIKKLYHVCTPVRKIIHSLKLLFVAVFLGCTSTGRVGLWFLLFYVQEHPKAQLAVVLVLKHLRRRGNGLKSNPKDWEKPGIELATPGLQDIGLSPTPFFCGFPGYKPVPPGWFKICVLVLLREHRKLFLWRSRESNLRPLVYKA